MIDKLDRYELVRIKLQQEIETYNNAVKRVGMLKRNLTADNAAIAHYEVSRDIELWRQALENQKKADEALKKSKFIVNNGYASAQDILDLILLVEKTVFDRFRVELEKEVILVNWE